MKIITQNIFPPIPSREFDWMAYFDGRNDGPTGFGTTEAEAIADLKSQIDEE